MFVQRAGNPMPLRSVTLVDWQFDIITIFIGYQGRGVAKYVIVFMLYQIIIIILKSVGHKWI